MQHLRSIISNEIFISSSFAMIARVASIISLIFITSFSNKNFGISFTGDLFYVLNLVLICFTIGSLGFDQYFVKSAANVKRSTQGANDVSFLYLVLLLNVAIFLVISAFFETKISLFLGLIIVVLFALQNIAPDIHRAMGNLNTFSFTKGLLLNFIIFGLLIVSANILDLALSKELLLLIALSITNIVHFILFLGLRKSHFFSFKVSLLKWKEQIKGAYKLHMAIILEAMLASMPIIVSGAYIDSQSAGVAALLSQIHNGAVFILGSINGILMYYFANQKSQRILGFSLFGFVQLIAAISALSYSVILLTFNDLILSFFGANGIISPNSLLIVLTIGVLHCAFGPVTSYYLMRDNVLVLAFLQGLSLVFYVVFIYYFNANLTVDILFMGALLSLLIWKMPAYIILMYDGGP